MTRPASARPSVRGRGRELLLSAARELFAAKGYNGTTTREIAERAGVTDVMLFRHFGTKANLFQEAAVQPFVEFMQRYVAQNRDRRRHGRTPVAEGRAFFDGLFEALHGQRQLLMALMSAREFDQVDEEISERAHQAFTSVLDVFEDVVSFEAESRGFRTVDLPADVRIMISMALSVALHGDWLLAGSAVSYERLLSSMTHMVVHGLAAPPPAR
jgi:AcrR family transcriptional regulator